MELEFEAALPPIQSAIRIDGSDEVVRIQLDCYSADLNKLASFKGKKFFVKLYERDNERQVLG